MPILIASAEFDLYFWNSIPKLFTLEEAVR